MSPGGSKSAYDSVEKYLKQWAAKTPQGEPCVEYIGPGGSGNYVKMLHNGIEHAHLSILCEARALLHDQLGMSNDEIAKLFEKWDKSGPLRGNFLVGIGFKGLRFKEGDGISDSQGIVEKIEDKVTQDVDRSEGTGTWSSKVRSDPRVFAQLIGIGGTSCGGSSHHSSSSSTSDLGGQDGAPGGYEAFSNPATAEEKRPTRRGPLGSIPNGRLRRNLGRIHSRFRSGYTHTVRR